MSVTMRWINEVIVVEIGSSKECIKPCDWSSALKESRNKEYTKRSSTPFSQMYWTKLEILLVTKARTCPSADFRQIVLDCQGCLLSL